MPMGNTCCRANTKVNKVVKTNQNNVKPSNAGNSKAFSAAVVTPKATAALSDAVVATSDAATNAVKVSEEVKVQEVERPPEPVDDTLYLHALLGNGP